MISVYFFIIAIIFTLAELTYKKQWGTPKVVEVFLGYILFFNMGLFGLLAAYAHVFMGPEIAREIGWQPGSPFQYEIGMANLSYGVLGILAYWNREYFWDAASIGWSVLLLGCFVGHLMDYYKHGNNAPYNIGPFIWFTDLFLPLLLLGLLIYIRKSQKGRTPGQT